MTGGPATVASDLYSLGATIYALIAGSAAHERKNDEDLVAQYLRISTTRVPDMRPEGIPERCVRRSSMPCRSNQPQRPASAAEFGRQLQSVQRSNGLRPDSMAITDTGHDSGSTGIACRMSPRRLEVVSGGEDMASTHRVGKPPHGRDGERPPFRRRTPGGTMTSKSQASRVHTRTSTRPQRSPNRPRPWRWDPRPGGPGQPAVSPALFHLSGGKPRGQDVSGSGASGKTAIASQWSPAPLVVVVLLVVGGLYFGMSARQKLRRARRVSPRPKHRRRRGSRYECACVARRGGGHPGRRDHLDLRRNSQRRRRHRDAGGLRPRHR